MLNYKKKLKKEVTVKYIVFGHVYKRMANCDKLIGMCNLNRIIEDGISIDPFKYQLLMKFKARGALIAQLFMNIKLKSEQILTPQQFNTLNLYNSNALYEQYKLLTNEINNILNNMSNQLDIFQQYEKTEIVSELILNCNKTIPESNDLEIMIYSLRICMIQDLLEKCEATLGDQLTIYGFSTIYSFGEKIEQEVLQFFCANPSITK